MVFDESRSDGAATHGGQASPVKKRILIALEGGGFAAQTLRLVELLGEDYHFEYVVTKLEYVSTKLNQAVTKRLPLEVDHGTGQRAKVYELTSPGIIGLSLWRQAVRFLCSVCDCWRIVRESRPDIIIGVGAALSAPLLLWGRVLGRKTIFIEDICRTDQLSRTARILYHLRLCDRLYVQWPELAASSRIHYRGKLL